MTSISGHAIVALNRKGRGRKRGCVIESVGRRLLLSAYANMTGASGVTVNEHSLDQY